MDDVVAGRHFQGEQHAGVAVLLDVAAAGVVFTLHGGNIADAHYLARSRVAKDNEVLHFLFASLCGFDMDGGLLRAGVNAAAYSSQALLLQLVEQHLLTDTVGLQALTVYVERNLLLQLAVASHIGH